MGKVVKRRGGGSFEHPGFANVASKIALEHNPKTGKPYGLNTAKAILASRTRGYSAADKARNPRLHRVKG